VPFRGGDGERKDLLARLGELELRTGDSLVVVDNGPGAPPPDPAIVHAPEVPSSYFARNRGGERGRAEWLVFIDADVVPPADLLDRYFDPQPGDEVGLLAGAVDDEEMGDPATLPPASRYAALTASMGQHNTLGEDGRGYAQTANCAVRREAFEQVGGFRPDVRSGGDADICFRLREAGWQLESRQGAAVIHRNRTTLRALVRQRARHGSGAAWLNREYPGAFPPNRSPGTIVWSVRELVGAGRARRRGERDAAVLASVGVVSHWAFELGRLLPNRPRRRA
jgi:glycosyl transferase family 2